MGCIRHTVPFTAVAHLFWNWEFVALSHPYLFLFPSTHFIPTVTCAFSVSMTVPILLCLFIGLAFLDSTCK